MPKIGDTLGRWSNKSGSLKILLGDCLQVTREIPSESVDAVVTDPPYGLSFMGKDWDHGVPGVPFWREFLRVIKPGGHLLAFGGTRTYHRLACNIEDAGWSIRDMVAWTYSSGFPKSLDVSKAIDKAAGAERTERVGPSYMVPNAKAVNPHFVGIAERRDDQPAEVEYAPTAPVTDAAKQWNGWGTCLKPSLEPITLARKPLEGTVAGNVLKHGTGALNIDGCRVGPPIAHQPGGLHRGSGNTVGAFTGSTAFDREPHGRWPANLIHDGSEEVLRRFPYDFRKDRSDARFFYCVKADRDDRIGSSHPTIKPLDLMQYLCRLVTPPGGLILDPFLGSGVTAEAALIEGFRLIGIEKNREYFEDAVRRVTNLRSEQCPRSKNR